MEDQIEKLKALHSCDIFTLKVKNKAGEQLTVFLKELDRITYKSNSALIQKDEMLGVEGLLRSLWVGGDEVGKIINDFKALRSAAVTLVPILEVEAGELKKN